MTFYIPVCDIVLPALDMASTTRILTPRDWHHNAVKGDRGCRLILDDPICRVLVYGRSVEGASECICEYVDLSTLTLVIYLEHLANGLEPDPAPIIDFLLAFWSALACQGVAEFGLCSIEPLLEFLQAMGVLRATDFPTCPIA
jgi:hypothetical protein